MIKAFKSMFLITFSTFSTHQNQYTVHINYLTIQLAHYVYV